MEEALTKVSMVLLMVFLTPLFIGLGEKEGWTYAIIVEHFFFRLQSFLIILQ